MYPRGLIDPPTGLSEPQRPLQLHERGVWDPAEQYCGEPDGLLEICLVEVIAAGPRPRFELERLLPGGEDPDARDPILEAVALRDRGQPARARALLEGLIEWDCRCLDAHAHLGALDFDDDPGAAHERTASPASRPREREIGARLEPCTAQERREPALQAGSLSSGRPDFEPGEPATAARLRIDFPAAAAMRPPADWTLESKRAIRTRPGPAGVQSQLRAPSVEREPCGDVQQPERRRLGSRSRADLPESERLAEHEARAVLDALRGSSMAAGVTS